MLDLVWSGDTSTIYPVYVQCQIDSRNKQFHGVHLVWITAIMLSRPAHTSPHTYTFTKHVGSDVNIQWKPCEISTMCVYHLSPIRLLTSMNTTYENNTGPTLHLPGARDLAGHSTHYDILNWPH